MDCLRRGYAPLSEGVWKAVDEAVVTAAKQELAARRVADFEGPKGWQHVAEPLGTTRPTSPACPGVTCAVPDVVLLAEIRADFTLPWAAIDAFARGARAMDTAPAEEAARNVALAEDRLAFHGGPGSTGFLTDGDVSRVGLGDWEDPARVAADLLAAVSALDRRGVGGPYAAVLEPARFFAYLRAAAERRLSTEADRLEGLIAGIHRSAVLEGGALFSLRGGDVLLTVGGDLTVGYRWHDAGGVYLFCVETIGAHLLNPAAVCVLKGG
jgi:uncharacterized linocin/CFP29 family protein